MIKTFIRKNWGVATMGVTLLAMFAACGNSGKDNEKVTEDQLEDSLKLIEQQSIENSIAAQDSVQQIDEMVNAVEEASQVSKDWRDTYSATFFNNEANKASSASATKYAQTPSGLKYAIVEAGNGKKPNAQSMVTVHYTGMLTDGTIFDSSIDRGEPTSFPLNRVIAGWTEGLQLMREGGVAVFYIPSSLGYGENGAPPIIPPSAPLIFWVQLLQVN